MKKSFDEYLKYYKKKGIWYKLIFGTRILIRFYLLLLTRLIPFSNINKFIYKIIGINIKGNCYLESDIYFDISHPELITIEKNVAISNRCMFLTHASIPTNSKLNKKFKRVAKSIKIGEGTVIFAGSKILPGVTIGKNCIIAAGSIVNKNIPSNSLAAGNPAKVKKKI